jgi:drug/metabolite transporter (DMT)-like permease
LNDTIYPIEHRKNAFRRPLWVAGFSSYLIANIIGSIFTIGYLPIVILAPIGAMGLVFNAIFAKLVLGDPFTRKSIVGMNISSELMWSGMDRSSSSIRFLNM